MKKFDLNRFGKVMSRLILVQRRSLTNTFSGFAITFFIIAMLNSQPFYWTALSHEEMAWNLAGAQNFISIICLVAFFVIATMVLLVTIAFPAVIMAAFLAADCAQQLLNMMIHHGGRASLIGAFSQFPMMNTGPTPLWAKLEAMLLSNAFAVLGGMLFRKTAWLKTVAAMTIIAISVLAGITLFAFLIQTNTDYVVYLPDTLWCHIINNIVCWALFILMYWGSYKLYTRMQVINNRWINI